jgi:peptidyl-prolyl cis-trans isomerase D
MLQTIRDRLTGPLLWAIVAILFVPFAFFGVQSLQGGGNGTDPTLAEVGGVKITQAQFHNAFEQAYRQLQQRMGDSFRADQVPQAQLRQDVMKQLVDEQVLRQYTRDVGYRIDDAGIRRYLESQPYFQENGHFSANRYRGVLASIGQSPEQYESGLRQNLPIEELRGAVENSAFITPRDADTAWKLDHQERTFSYVKFEPAKYLPGINVSDDQIKQRYDSKKDSYKAPERIKLSYVELALDQLPKSAAPGAEVLKAIYDARKATLFSVPEERHVSHILINFGADKNNSRKKAEDLYAKIKAGADFAELAKAESDDAGSKSKGGDLGWLRRGYMPPKFEAAEFDLAKAGDVSEPVETEAGWHIIKLDELHPAQTKAFDDAEVQKRLLDLYQQQDLNTRFQDDAGKLDQLSFENPGSLDVVAKTLNLPVKTTDWVTRKGGADITANPAVIAAAFSQQILGDGENSKPIALDPTHLVVVRKAEYEAPRQYTLDEVKDQIRTELRDEGAKAQAESAATALLKTLEGGQSFDAAVKAAGLSALNAGTVQRDAKGQTPELLQAVFKMPHPAAGKMAYSQADVDNGDIAVIALSSVSAAVPQSGDSAAQNTMVQLRDARAGADFSAYSAEVQKQVKVKIMAAPQAANEGEQGE